MSSPRLFKQLFAPPASILGAGGILYTTVTAASNNVNLPTGTINVNSTAGFPTSGQFGIQVLINFSYAYVTVSYTGITATSFTGCTGGTGTMITGSQIGLIGSIVTGTWTCPAGVKYIIVTGCGGGGGGGGGASSSGRGITYFAGGGSGGHPSPTSTQIVQVTPGVVYTISVGQGGIGGTSNCVANIVSPTGGGTKPGNPGSDGSASIFGSIIFPGGKGGREGQLISANTLTFPVGADCANAAFSGSTNPTPQNIQAAAERAPFTPSTAVQGIAHAVNRATNQYSLSGGGTAGGVSNNIYSVAGSGGQGAQGFDGAPFAGYGGNGNFGGGGGGAGGGENWDYNNTHDGGLGGWGGSGFIEVAWMA
jgi:hypothetical protein